MTEETLTALRDSIAHWTRLSDGTALDGEAPGATYCALCELFLTDSFRTSCKGCPIMEKTGIPFCGESPYKYASLAWTRGGYSTTFREAAAVMRDFLIDLIPEGEKL